MATVLDNDCKGMTLVDRVKYWAVTNPRESAFIFFGPTGRHEMSRAEVLDLSSRFAYRLTRHGIKPKDVVCIALPNSPQRVVAEFGIHLAGAVSLNGQVLRADGEDLISSLDKARSTAIGLDPDYPSGAWQLCKHAFDTFQMYDNHADINSQRIPSLTKAFISKPTGSKNNLLETLNEEKSLIYEESTPNDVCAIFTTSGSTGYSKLAPHSHEAVLAYEYEICEALAHHQGLKLFNSSPFGWLGGFSSFYLYAGFVHVALDESCGDIPDKPVFIWDVLCKENLKYAYFLPGMMKAVSDERSRKHPNGHKLTRIITGGQPVTKDNLTVIGELTDSVTVLYGSSELCEATIVTFDSSNVSNIPNNMSGYPFAGIKLKVVDKYLKPVPPMSKGEILVHTPTLTRGYIKMDSNTEEDFLPDGWFRTGDTGFLREDGCLFVEGRSSDAIMHGVYILYPTWLEQMLIKCSGVKEVVIVPVPDKILHHEICACVRLDETSDVHPTAEDIINFCKNETVLDESSDLNVIPKYVLFFTEFPRTNTDKLDRKSLAGLAKQQLGL